MAEALAFEVRQARSEDVPGIIALCRRVYPSSPAWSEGQLASHQAVFPEGQLVALAPDGEVVGFAACLIVLWDDYEMGNSWRDFTAGGWFTNHDPQRGRTLYGAEIMVDPARQGHGIGKSLYAARRALVERLGLLRIRAGARLRGYHLWAETHSPVDYVMAVVQGRIGDPTLSFQLGQGFEVLAVVGNYLRHDPESHGYAAVIEWLNPAVATEADRHLGDPRFRAVP